MCFVIPVTVLYKQGLRSCNMYECNVIHVVLQISVNAKPVTSIKWITSLFYIFETVPNRLWMFVHNRSVSADGPKENDWCFRPRFCTYKAILGWGQPGLMGWILLWILPLVQDRSLDLLASSTSRYHCTTDVPPGPKGNIHPAFWYIKMNWIVSVLGHDSAL